MSKKATGSQRVTPRRRRVQIVKITVMSPEGTTEEVDAKECSKCNAVKALTEYHKGKAGGRVTGYCKECAKTYMAQYYLNNRTKLQEGSRRYYIENLTRVRETKRQWRINNPSKNIEGATKYHRRKKSTPNTLTKYEYENILSDFNGCCALTGENTNVQLDHWIAVSTQFAGTCYGNVYPLSKALNTSKRSENPYVWIQRRPDIDADKFDALERYLADQNGMTVEAFREYTYRCYNAKVIDSG